MKIKSISIKNYKGFENFSAEFHDELTVILGDNGAGKSSLLDAVSITAPVVYGHRKKKNATAIL